MGDFFARALRTLRKGFYPVAKINWMGSGSNKFGLAVLAWEKGRVLARPGWAGEIVCAHDGASQPAFEQRG